MDLAEKHKQRYTVLSKLYEACDGDRRKRVDYDELQQATGLERQTFHGTIRYLQDEGLLKKVNLVVELTHAGVVEMEQSFQQPKESTVHFPAQIIQQFHGPVGAVQNAPNSGANVHQNIDNDGELLKLISELRKSDLSEHIEAMDLVNGIEEEVNSGRPRKGRVRAFLARLDSLNLQLATKALLRNIDRVFDAEELAGQLSMEKRSEGE